MIDCTNGKLSECIKHARLTKDSSIIKCLKRLRNVDRKQGSETKIYPDWAPLSLYFERVYADSSKTNGGIIYHGSHDGYGSGSVPTFSVCLSKTSGWSIHT